MKTLMARRGRVGFLLLKREGGAKKVHGDVVDTRTKPVNIVDIMGGQSRESVLPNSEVEA